MTIRDLLFLILAAFVVPAFVGCGGGDDDDSSAGDDDDAAAGEALTVVTYNAGLAVGFVPGAEDRATQVPDAIAALDADIVCVQEVWTDEHVQGLATAAATAFPHQFFPEASQLTDAAAACTADDLDPLIGCMEGSCDLECLDELIDCMFASCALNFLTLEKGCMECVQANVGGTAQEISDTCTTEHTHYAYGGAFGTGILSAYPLSNTEEHVFDSTTNRRSLLHAVAATPQGDVDVYCTHLTAVFDLIPYPKEEGSWAEEQTAQIEDMVAHIDSNATTGQVVLMGDMNCGPDVGSSVADQEDNWELLAASGMAVPYVDAEGPCTFCPDNPLMGADSDDDPRVIDHVLLEGFDGATTAERVLDEEITTELCGEEIAGAYSDHYGVSVTIEAE